MATELTTASSGALPVSSSDWTALESLKGWASTFLGDSERVPASIARLVPSALRAAEASLQPANPKILAVELDGLLTWARSFNVPVDNPASIAKFYAEAIGHLPADLIVLGMKRARGSHKYGMRLPLPSEIVAEVQPEIAERSALLRKLTMARLAPVESPDGPKITDADKARVDAVMRQFRSERAEREAAEQAEERKHKPKPIYVPNPTLDAYVAAAQAEKGAA